MKITIDGQKLFITKENCRSISISRKYARALIRLSESEGNYPPILQSFMKQMKSRDLSKLQMEIIIDNVIDLLPNKP